VLEEVFVYCFYLIFFTITLCHQKIYPRVMRTSDELIYFELWFCIHIFYKIVQRLFVLFSQSSQWKCIMITYPWVICRPSIPSDNWSKWSNIWAGDGEGLNYLKKRTSSNLDAQPSYLALICVLVAVRTRATLQSPALSFRSMKLWDLSHEGMLAWVSYILCICQLFIIIF